MLLVRILYISSILCHKCISKITPTWLRKKLLKDIHNAWTALTDRSNIPKVVTKGEEDEFILKRFSTDYLKKGIRTSSKAQGTNATHSHFSMVLWIILLWKHSLYVMEAHPQYRNTLNAAHASTCYTGSAPTTFKSRASISRGKF